MNNGFGYEEHIRGHLPSQNPYNTRQLWYTTGSLPPNWMDLCCLQGNFRTAWTAWLMSELGSIHWMPTTCEAGQRGLSMTWTYVLTNLLPRAVLWRIRLRVRCLTHSWPPLRWSVQWQLPGVRWETWAPSCHSTTLAGTTCLVALQNQTLSVPLEMPDEEAQQWSIRDRRSSQPRHVGFVMICHDLSKNRRQSP